jgi:hypothetical protein
VPALMPARDPGSVRIPVSDPRAGMEQDLVKEDPRATVPPLWKLATVLEVGPAELLRVPPGMPEGMRCR